jgi:hypothetical protein
MASPMDRLYSHIMYAFSQFGARDHSLPYITQHF